MQTLAIIGAGFSGTMVAVHLLRRGCPVPTNVVLIERTARFTAGAAYGTQCQSHLLNVPAGRMSAFEDPPDHFLRWAQSRDPAISGATFVQRRIYGEYLADLLNGAESAAPQSMQLLRVPGQAVAIARHSTSQLTIHLDRGGLIRADKVVLAIGNFPPADPPVSDSTFYQDARYVRDPWAADALQVAPDEGVLLIGTGLTMLDVALALEDQGHRGAIHALSRRGLLPQPHRQSDVPPPQHPRPRDLDRWPHTALGILRALRREVAQAVQRGVDWREVVTSIRHDTAHLWQSMSQRERARFLQQLRPFWETHRHRSAPAIAARIDHLIQTGQLNIIAGRVLGFDCGGESVAVQVRPRGDRQNKTLHVSRVINCTGPDTNLARVREPLIEHMRESGMIRPDSLGLGVDTDQAGAIISADGRPCRQLFLLGPLRKGQLWENTAVPELRIEAERLAAHLAGEIASVARQSIDAGYAMQC